MRRRSASRRSGSVRKRAPMVLNARQIASGAALLISAFCAFVLYARGFELQMQLGCVLLVCMFAYLFLSSSSPNREDTEESSQSVRLAILLLLPFTARFLPFRVRRRCTRSHSHSWLCDGKCQRGARDSSACDRLACSSVSRTRLAKGRGASDAAAAQRTPHSREWLCYRAVLQNRDEGLAMECRHGVIQDVVGPLAVFLFLARFALEELRARERRPVRFARVFDGAGDVLGDGGRELHKLSARRLQREAMLVVAAMRVRPERGDADAVFALDRPRVPRARRAVGFRRHPAFDVPAIHRGIFRFLAQFDDFADERAGFIALLEFSADPGEAVPAPHGAIVGLAERIAPAGQFESLSFCLRRVVRFAGDLDGHGEYTRAIPRRIDSARRRRRSAPPRLCWRRAGRSACAAAASSPMGAPGSQCTRRYAASRPTPGTRYRSRRCRTQRGRRWRRRWGRRCCR